MRMKPYENREGKRVWLSTDEIEQVIDEAKDTEQHIALSLAARCGLRRKEIVQITPADLVTSEKENYHLRVWEDVAKKGHYREPPVPDLLADKMETMADLTAMDRDDPFVSVSDRTVYRWLNRATDRIEERTQDEGWSRVDVHDLRRSWATHILGEGVLPSVVMSWGGWHDWDTFRKHYLGEFSPEVLDRERQKVDYLADGDALEADSAGSVMPPSSSSIQHANR
ncbi:site-specific integrase [Salinigranum marinum]|uniref:site-specific integrase n=1 Tax=Salinigranum marinum TaxID=1515595 RepID=UPI002989F108|nr:site-specific integrase [Salinigranum marinum]